LCLKPIQIFGSCVQHPFGLSTFQTPEKNGSQGRIYVELIHPFSLIRPRRNFLVTNYCLSDDEIFGRLSSDKLHLQRARFQEKSCPLPIKEALSCSHSARNQNSLSDDEFFGRLSSHKTRSWSEF